MKEKNIRLFWLLTLCIPQIIQITYGLLFPNENIRTLSVVLGGILSVLFVWMMIYCAYKKPGTKLLTFFVYAWPISLLVSVAIHLYYSMSYDALSLTLLPFGVIWYAMTLRLRKINRKLRAESL